MTLQALPYITLQAILFGTTLIASRFVVGQIESLTYVGVRLALASLLHVGIYLLSPKRSWPRERQVWRHAPILGIFSTALPMSLIVGSLQYQSSGVTALLLTTGPALTVLMAHFWLHDERLTVRKGVGIGLAVLGAALLILLGESGLPDVQEANPLGYFMVILAMLLASGMTIYARKYMRNLDPLDVASVRMWTAAIFMLPISMLLVGFDLSGVTAQGYAAWLYAALVGTFSGMMLAFYTIQRFGATASALAANLIPIVALIGGVLILDETITMGMLLGTILIISGMVLLNQRTYRTTGQNPPT